MENVLADNWQQFGIVCMAIVAVATAIKRTVRVKWPTFPEGQLGKAIMSWLNIALGIASGVPGYLPGDTFTERAMVGIVAGLLSAFFYNAFIKRVFPNQKPDKDGMPPAAPTSVPDA